MITYNDLYEANRKEKYSEKLEFLPKNFLGEVGEYFSEKKQLVSQEDHLFSEAIAKTKKQLENAVMLFKELMRQRRKKLLQLAFVASETGIAKRDFDNMLDFEKRLFESMMKSVELADKEIDQELKGDRKEDQKYLMVLCLAHIDSFVGLDGNPLGPYEKGQVVNLAKTIAEILIADGKAETVDE